MKRFFAKFANRTGRIMGSWQMFSMAVGIFLLWVISGPFFHFSDTWQLVINTGTTIFTFFTGILMLYTQNRDMVAIHLKLDEVIYALKEASNEFIAVEEDTDEELQELEVEFEHVHEEVHKRGRG